MTIRSSAAANVFVQPDPRRNRITVTVDGESRRRMTARIDGTAAHGETDTGSLRLDLADFAPWSPATPQIYTLRCTFPDQADHDDLTIAFGMREVSLQDQRVTINQRPVVLKGCVYNPGAPGAFPIDALRRAAFNWLRISSEHATPDILAQADALGLLVSLDAPHDTDTARLEQRVRAFRNHAAVFAWHVPPNDSLIQTLRNLDPTRIVCAADNRKDTGAAAARLYRPFREAPEPFDPVNVSVLAPLSRETETFLERLGHAAACTIVTVHGLAPWRDHAAEEKLPFPRQEAASSWQSDLESTQAEAIRSAVDALRANARIAGLCFADACAHEGGAPNNTGRLAAFEDAFAAVRPVIRIARTNLTPREDVDVTVVLLNEARLDQRADLSLQVVGPTNQVLWKKKRNVKLPRHGKELWSGTISSSGSTGPHRFVVRLMGPSGRLAEASASFYVTDPVDAWAGDIDIVDRDGNWTSACRPLVRDLDVQATILVIPPLGSTVRAYPDNALGQALGRVRDGAVAIVFSPPPDWSDLMTVLDAPMDIEAISSFAAPGTAAIGRLHPALDGLPARGLLGRPYRGVLPGTALTGQSEEEVAWRVRWNAAVDSAHLVLVRRFGNGRIVFTPLQLLERLARDPVAQKLFVNLLAHSGRRAFASSGIPPLETAAVEWIRKERAALQTWRLIGPFPNWDGAGHQTAFPPEHEFNPEAAYAGWFRAVAWETWCVANDGRERVDLARALAPKTLATDVMPGTFYAFADPVAEARQEAVISIAHQGAAKLWINDRLAIDAQPDREDAPAEQTAKVLARQGRNSLLIKLSAQRGRPWFRLGVDLGSSRLTLRW